MKKLRKHEDLYFYKGKFYTELGLKRALAKDGELTFSRGTFYLYEAVFEYYYKFDYFRDLLHDRKLINDDEYKHFQKWINERVRSGEIKVLRDHTFYHIEANDGVGDDWDYVLEGLRNYGTSEGELIKKDEEVIEDYCQTLTEEQFHLFCLLPDIRQFNIASMWAIGKYQKEHETNEQRN